MEQHRTTCPKCGDQLWQSREPDYGTCLNHGDQYLYTPLEYVDASELPGEAVEAREVKRLIQKSLKAAQAIKSANFHEIDTAYTATIEEHENRKPPVKGASGVKAYRA